MLVAVRFVDLEGVSVSTVVVRMKCFSSTGSGGDYDLHHILAEEVHDLTAIVLSS